MKNRNANMGIGLIMGLCVMGSVPAAHAGDLEPSGPPGSTMKTLDQIPPTWDQILPAASRFKLVMSGAAVLDKETGLVWEQSPNTNHLSWYTGASQCDSELHGGRGGWRLPTIQELLSLVDATQQAPALPPGNPFSNLQLGQTSYYWTNSIAVGTSTDRYIVRFYDGTVTNMSPIDGNEYRWCVRGG